MGIGRDWVPYSVPGDTETFQIGAACPETLNVIYSQNLVNQSETSCKKDDGVITNAFPGRFGRGTPFGFSWQDLTPKNSTIFTVTIAVQAGISCTTIPGEFSGNKLWGDLWGQEGGQD